MWWQSVFCYVWIVKNSQSYDSSNRKLLCMFKKGNCMPGPTQDIIIKYRTPDIYCTGYYLHAFGMWTERLHWTRRVPREGMLLLSFSNWSYSTSLTQIVDENCCSLWQQIDGVTLFPKQWMAKGFKIWTQISNWSLNLCHLSAAIKKPKRAHDLIK